MNRQDIFLTMHAATLNGEKWDNNMEHIYCTIIIVNRATEYTNNAAWV